MYKEFYGLEGSGFKMTPDRRLRFSYPSYTDAFDTLLEARIRGDGFVVLTGAQGAGKTILIDDLAARLANDGCIVGKVTISQVDADDLMRLVGFEFGLRADALSKPRLLTKLSERLTGKNSSGQPVVLLIDEAQDLSVDALEELRLLFDLIAGRGQIVQILLAGRERLGERLRQPGCEEIRDLVVESCRLLPLSPNETRAYVAHSLRHMGWKGEPEIRADALRLIHERTGGVPRLINLTMSRLLLHGGLGELRALGSHDVETVLEQMGEDHPELLLDTSKQQTTSHPGLSDPLLPLDAPAAVNIEPRKRLLQNSLLLPIKGQEFNAATQSLMDWLKPVARWNWKRALAGLSAATVSVYMVFIIGFEGDDSVSAATRAADGREKPRFTPPFRAHQSAPERAETPSVRNARMVARVEADRDVGDLRQGVEWTEDLAPVPTENKSAIASPGPTPNSHQDPLVGTMASVTPSEIAEAVQPSGSQAKGQDQQDRAGRGISELLAKAERALSNDRLTVPSGDSAYAYYQTVLARAPNNARARAGVRRIVQRYRQLAEQQLSKRDLRGARLFASRGLKIWPQDKQLLTIKRQADEPQAAQQESELPQNLQRVAEWFRSGDTTTSAFLDQ